MPSLANSFRDGVVRATSLAQAGEQAQVMLSGLSRGAPPLYPARLELLYEMAYLRVFIEWETFLEQSFLRYLCGYTNTIGQQAMVQGNYYSTLATAETAILGNRQYVLWHNPSAVVGRSKAFFSTGLHESVLASNLTRLDWFAAIRHRVAHAQPHARKEFDRATMSLNGFRYQGGRPGKFLRDWHPYATPRTRWLEIVGGELINLARQITP